MALLLHRDGACAWRLTGAERGVDVGGIRYEHSRTGDHYRAWLLTDGIRHDLAEPVPQLAMAVRAVEAELARLRGVSERSGRSDPWSFVDEP